MNRATRRRRPPRARFHVPAARRILRALDSAAEGSLVAGDLEGQLRPVVVGHDRALERRRTKRKASKRARKTSR